MPATAAAVAAAVLTGRIANRDTIAMSPVNRMSFRSKAKVTSRPRLDLNRRKNPSLAKISRIRSVPLLSIVSRSPAFDP
jgi:hypothetical protein